MIFKDALSALKEAFGKRIPVPLTLSQKNHFKTLVNQLARLDLGSIENTLAANPRPAYDAKGSHVGFKVKHQ